jgi:sulfite exporter TauE/SafE
MIKRWSFLGVPALMLAFGLSGFPPLMAIAVLWLAGVSLRRS